MQCKYLTGLILGRHLDSDHENITEQGMVDFINSMPSLRLLNVSDCFHSSWSFRIFIAVAQHKKLQELKLPCIPDEWIPELVSVLPESMFPEIDSICLDLSDNVLEALLPSLARIRRVSLCLLQGRPRRALACAARCPGLIGLDLYLEPGKALQEKDLLQLNENCRELCWLLINGSDVSDVLSEGITDTTIDQVARYHPKLRFLHLFLTGCTLTEQSLVSLGEYCKLMEQIILPADVSLEVLLRDDHQDRFPNLRNSCFFSSSL